MSERVEACYLQQYDYVDRPPAPLMDQINLAVDSLCTLGLGERRLAGASIVRAMYEASIGTIILSAWTLQG